VDVARLFPKTVLTGEKFGTVTVVLPECMVEVTTFRTDGDYTDGRHPESVEFVSGIDEDLSRRDFTINAMAESAEGELIDPFGGMDDIKNGIIKCVGGPNTRFSEDALRMFRALRFSAQLGFAIEPETLQAIYAGAGMARRISAERVRIELEKTLMSQRPEIAGEMIKIGLLDKYMTQSGKKPDGLEKIKKLPMEQTLRWCAFCAVLLEKHYINSAPELLHSMHLDGKTIKTCLRALAIDRFPIDKVAVKRLLSKNDATVVRCAAAVSDVLFTDSVKNAVLEGNPPQESALDFANSIIACGECTTLAGLAVAGRDLLEHGHSAGKDLGEILNKLLEHVIEHPEDNTHEKLLELADEISKLKNP
jgi:tRNA nucleotidyltransferase (CCA-adding enzyme)